MKKILNVILVLSIINFFALPTFAETPQETTFSENTVEVQVTNIPSSIRNGEPIIPTVPLFNEIENNTAEPNALGVTYYYFVITIWLVNNGQQLYDTIEYISTVYDCATAIKDFVDDYMNNEHVVYPWEYQADYTGSVVDNGCWTQQTPWNPFCRIATQSDNKEEYVE